MAAHRHIGVDGVSTIAEAGPGSDKRCYLVSAALHALLLALVFWRGAPVASRPLAGQAIEVSLIESLGRGKPDGEPRGTKGGVQAIQDRHERRDQKRRNAVEAVKAKHERKEPAPAAPVEEKPGGHGQASLLNGDAGSGGLEPPGGEGSSGRGTEVQASSLEGDPTLQLISRKIEAAKRYPRAARAMGIEGTVVVRFRLEPSGQVEEVEVAQSSGSGILDRASLETVRDAAPLPYKEGWLKVGIVFQILSR